MIVNLEICLPADLRGPATTIAKISAGLSGAGVHRIEAAGQAFVLTISGGDKPIADWRRKLHIQQLAANAGLAPRVIHAHEAKRAVVTALVVDRSFITTSIRRISRTTVTTSCCSTGTPPERMTRPTPGKSGRARPRRADVRHPPAIPDGTGARNGAFFHETHSASCGTHQLAFSDDARASCQLAASARESTT